MSDSWYDLYRLATQRHREALDHMTLSRLARQTRLRTANEGGAASHRQKENAAAPGRVNRLINLLLGLGLVVLFTSLAGCQWFSEPFSGTSLGAGVTSGELGIEVEVHPLSTEEINATDPLKMLVIPYDMFRTVDIPLTEENTAVLSTAGPGVMFVAEAELPHVDSSNDYILLFVHDLGNDFALDAGSFGAGEDVGVYRASVPGFVDYSGDIELSTLVSTGGKYQIRFNPPQE